MNMSVWIRNIVRKLKMAHDKKNETRGEGMRKDGIKN